MPFFGYNFVIRHYPLPNAGVAVSFKNFAIEGAYYFPVSYDPVVRVHFSIKVTISRSWETFFDS
ncbi:MAG: hypothetical protein LBJ31_11805 [Treponema sp.]|jgi:hypothetical protein|nr:hypothetical protein [Treponema sp.]